VNRFLAFFCLIAASPLGWCQPKIEAVVNAATFQPGLPYGGGLAAVFVSGLSGAPGTYLPASSAPLPFALAGYALYLNNAPCPILAVVIPPAGQSGLAQINFQVPLERNASIRPSPDGYPGYLVINGHGLNIVEDPLPAPGPGGFFSDGNGYAIAQHASDYSTVTLQNPARAGETIIAYANDLYPVWPPPPVGYPTLQPALFLFSQTVVPGVPTFIPSPGNLYLQNYPGPIDPPTGSTPSAPPPTILFQGLAAGLVGTEQINFVVPANQQPGDWALFFAIGCKPGQVSGCFLGNASPLVKLPVR
jgi:uncharacterized protein (TIGR03437 family)